VELSTLLPTPLYALSLQWKGAELSRRAVDISQLLTWSVSESLLVEYETVKPAKLTFAESTRFVQMYSINSDVPVSPRKDNNESRVSIHNRSRSYVRVAPKTYVEDERATLTRRENCRSKT
jgi:hypothetical protein